MRKEIGKKEAPKIEAKGRVQIGGKKSLSAPDFNSLFDPSGMEGLPEIEQIDPEQVTSGEISEALKRIIEEKRNRLERYRDQVDSEFYLVVCFQSRKQKEAFLDKAGWVDLGNKYIDGLEVANRIGVEVEPVQLEIKKPGIAPKSMRGMEVI